MRELVVLSGKGGTGKTSIAASLAVLSGRCVLADCDVDAPDLHLVLAPVNQEHHEFFSGHVARIRHADCAGCGACLDHCRFDAVLRCDGDHGACIGSDAGPFTIDPIACEGCGVCVQLCPGAAIDFPDRLCGEWFISETRCGPMVHARLGVAQGNSGKLVSIVRGNARSVAMKHQCDLVIIDGSPGIGCPVIASVTGAGLALVVTEPTLSGDHDLKRILDLIGHFGIPAAVCINKWDVNPDLTRRIEDYCRQRGVVPAGRIRYDRAMTRAQVARRTIVEVDGGGIGEDIRALWASLSKVIRHCAHSAA